MRVRIAKMLWPGGILSVLAAKCVMTAEEYEALTYTLMRDYIPTLRIE